MNYYKVGTTLRSIQYEFYDLPGGYFRSVFEKNGLSVKLECAYKLMDSPYIIVNCLVNKRKIKLFEQAMRDLEWKMLVCGHNDYPKFCDDHIKLHNKDKITKQSLFLFIKKLYIIYRAEKASMES